MLSSISSTLTSGWNVLETLVTDKPPAGEKDWCAGAAHVPAQSRADG